MAHKTLTISEEAYEALARLKGKNESFTEVVLRLAEKKSRKNLLAYIRSLPPDEELAGLINEALKKRSKIRVRIAGR